MTSELGLALSMTLASASNSAAGISMIHQAGTIASPLSTPQNYDLGQFLMYGYGTTTTKIGGLFKATCIDPSASDTAMGTRWSWFASPVGSVSLSEVLRLEAGSGISMFGANPVIDQNRAIRLRSTTVAAAITPSVAGNLFYHSNAQGGAGEVAVDTGSAYRHAGQAALKRLTTDADATYTPRTDGRIIRDLATLTADRKLTLATTNVTDGHKVEITRRGSSGGHVRNVYQADGMTLIVALADNTIADINDDAAAALWFQK
jgi:hypothetical protein